MKPYSPLPWRSFIQCGDAIIKDANGESTFGDTSYYPWVECRDFDYIVHAANAYPKLIEVLRRILIESDRTMATGSRDLLDWQDDNRAQGDRARALLRELDEL